MNFRVVAQLDEAFGPDNRWFCSQCYGRTIDDPELLLQYFVRSGGAENFAFRYRQAMGPVNRWYCSKHYCYDVRNEETLWRYFMENHIPVGHDHRSKSRSEAERGESAVLVLA